MRNIIRSYLFVVFSVTLLATVAGRSVCSATMDDSDKGGLRLQDLFPMESDFSSNGSSGNGSFFSTQVEGFAWNRDDVPTASRSVVLGQKKRRRGGGGRVWTNLYYGDTVLEPSDRDFKIKPDFYGVQFGFDVVRSHGVYNTFYGNYNRSKTKLGDVAESRIENYLFGFGRYYYLKGCHFGFSGNFGYDHYKGRDKQSVEKRKESNGDGMQMNLFGEFGIDLILGRWAVKPFYALQYDFLYHGRIGGGEHRFQGDWNGHGFEQLFGLRLNWKPLDCLEFQTRTTWVHEFLSHPPPFYHARFSPVQGTSTPAIFFYDGNSGRDWAWIGVGMKWEPVFNIYVYFDYDVTINERHTTHFGCLGLCLGW